jgi:hypothetical protein
MCQWFAPTELNVSFEREGKGRFTEEEVNSIVVRDKLGRVIALNLPTKSVVVANHQVQHSVLLNF